MANSFEDDLNTTMQHLSVEDDAFSNLPREVNLQIYNILKDYKYLQEEDKSLLDNLPREEILIIYNILREYEFQQKKLRSNNTNEATRDLANSHARIQNRVTELVEEKIQTGEINRFMQPEHHNRYYNMFFEELRQTDPRINNAIVELTKIRQQQSEALQRFNDATRIINNYI